MALVIRARPGSTQALTFRQSTKQFNSALNQHFLQQRKVMTWLILVIAGLFETAWAIGLKYTDGFSRFWPSFWTIVAMVISVWLLGLSVKTLPVGTAYAIWVGIGAVGTVILGIWLFNEPVSPLRIISLLLIIAGIIGLKLASPD
jgi:quaternary ammonium compound-resistance protein SugE